MEKTNAVRSVALGFVIIASMFVLLNIAEEVSATTYVVDSSGGTPYMTIGQALAVASNGDIIQVNPGIGYTETNVINVRVTIVGNGAIRLVVSAVSGSTNPVFDIQTRDVTIDFLEIIGTGTSSIAGVRSDVQTTEHDNINIKNCTIHDFTNNGYGLLIKRTNPSYSYPTNHVIDNCEIYNCNTGVHIESDPNLPAIYPNHVVKKSNIHDICNNGAGTMGHGIYNFGDKNQFENNEISYCQNNGIYLDKSELCNIYDTNINGHPCYIHNNSRGIYLYDCKDTTILGQSMSRMVTVIYNTNDGIYIEDSDDNELQYVDSANNTDYGIYFDNSDYNTLRSSEITNNYYTYGDYSTGNYVFLDSSNHNIIEDNYILNSTGTSHIYIVGFESHNNTIDNNELDGDIYIGSGDDNTITNMEFEYLYINYGEDNTVQYCDILNSYGPLVTLHQAHGTYIKRVDFDGIDDDDNGIEIEDSKDVEISGYKSGSSFSIIQNCDIALYVISDDVSSSVFFHHYNIRDSNGDGLDITLYGTVSYSTTVTYNNLIGGFEEYDDDYSTWTWVP